MPRQARRPPAPTRQGRALSFRKTRADNASETAQDYVEAIAELLHSNRVARPADLARMFGVSHVTVIRTVARLRRDGLATAKPHRSIRLTSRGAALAAECRKRHELVVAFLLALGVPCAAAESDAEGIEHHLSRATINAMRSFLRKHR